MDDPRKTFLGFGWIAALTQGVTFEETLKKLTTDPNTYSTQLATRFYTMTVFASCARYIKIQLPNLTQVDLNRCWPPDPPLAHTHFTPPTGERVDLEDSHSQG